MIIKKAFWFSAAVVFLLVIFLPGFSKLQELREKNRNLEAKIRDLSKQNVLLQQELKDIETDPIYQEKIARDKLGIVRKGEIPVKIIPERAKD